MGSHGQTLTIAETYAIAGASLLSSMAIRAGEVAAVEADGLTSLSPVFQQSGVEQLSVSTIKMQGER
jgi:hypothetical protein